jgi:sortase A
VLEDADGRRYDDVVFRRKIVGPREVSVAEPVPGKSMVSLQTCTVPDYAERLVAQAAFVHGPL